MAGRKTELTTGRPATPKKRSRSHLFKPGQSGNPNGRPLGKQPATILQEALAEKLGHPTDKEGREAALRGFFRRVLDLAIDAGDAQAIGLVMRRLLPELKSVEAPQPLAIDPSADPAKMVRQGLQALASGEISLDQVVRLASTVNTTAGLEQAAEFEERLSRLEEIANASK